MRSDKLKSVVYLVDDEDAIRDSLTLFIESTGQAVKSFACAKDFLNDYCPDQPSCLILDVRMPEMGGLELQEELSKRGIIISIVFISGHARITDSAKAFRGGAIDFLEKPFDGPLLIERINEAIKKDTESFGKRKLQKRIDNLTPREKQVLSFIASGHPNKEIAKLLQVSNRTVEAHRAHIMEKLQVENIMDLMVLVMQCKSLDDSL
ncbi:MAG: response regulator transcription factor [Methylococcaceae bacterium]